MVEWEPQPCLVLHIYSIYETSNETPRATSACWSIHAKGHDHCNWINNTWIWLLFCLHHFTAQVWVRHSSQYRLLISVGCSCEFRDFPLIFSLKVITAQNIYPTHAQALRRGKLWIHLKKKLKWASLPTLARTKGEQCLEAESKSKILTSLHTALLGISNDL